MKLFAHYILVTALLVFTFLSACDRPECPYLDERLCDSHFRDSIAGVLPDTTNNGIIPDTGIVVGDRVLMNPTAFQNIARNTLLEYYTGFRCANCPPASATAKNLKNVHGEQLVLVFIHATSFFAAPINPAPQMYSTDLRTNQGETFSQVFQINSLPTGSINRKNFGTGIPQQHGSWPERIFAENAATSNVFLGFRKVTYQPELNSVRIQLAYRINTGNYDQYNLVVGLTENGIVEGQKDGATDIFPYEHNFVFRGNLNGIWGSELSNPIPLLTPDQAVLLEVTYPLDAQWKFENSALMAYIMNRDSYEVFQVTEAPLAP